MKNDNTRVPIVEYEGKKGFAFLYANNRHEFVSRPRVTDRNVSDKKVKREKSCV